MQIKTTRSHHFTPTGMAFIKKKKKEVPRARDNVEKWNPPSLLVALLTGQPLWKSAWRFLKKVNNGTTI